MLDSKDTYVSKRARLRERPVGFGTHAVGPETHVCRVGLFGLLHRMFVEDGDRRLVSVYPAPHRGGG